MKSYLLIILLVFSTVLAPACAVNNDRDPGKISVKEDLEITSFELSSDSVDYGNEIKVIWSVSGADTIKLDVLPDRGETLSVQIYDAVGELSFNPTSDTTFKLSAKQGSLSLKGENTVLVTEPAQASASPVSGLELVGTLDPSIRVELSATPSCLRAGDATKLVWSTTGANEVFFDPITVNARPTEYSGQRIVPLTASKEFTLIGHNLVTGAYNQASVNVTVKPVQYQVTINPVFVKTHSSVVMDPLLNNRFYLISGKELFQADGGSLQSIFTAPINISSVAVTLNSDGVRTLYVAYKGMVRRHREGENDVVTGQPAWGYVSVKYYGAPLEIPSMAAIGDNAVFVTPQGLYLYSSPNPDTVPTLSLVNAISVSKVYAGDTGFLAATSNRVYYSVTGQSWSERNLPMSESPHFFYQGDALMAVTDSGKAYEEYGTGGWSEILMPNGTVKAMEFMDDEGGLMALSTGKIFVQEAGGSVWTEALVSGSLPSAVLAQLGRGGKTYLSDGEKVYEWSAELAPLSCAQ